MFHLAPYLFEFFPVCAEELAQQAGYSFWFWEI